MHPVLKANQVIKESEVHRIVRIKNISDKKFLIQLWDLIQMSNLLIEKKTYLNGNLYNLY